MCVGLHVEINRRNHVLGTVETESLQSNREETDTRVVLYCVYAQEKGYATARVKTPDTDIFFILLHDDHRLTDLLSSI